MKFASRSAIESANSANAGSKASRGKLDVAVLPLGVSGWPSLSEVREEGRRGVVGRDEGLGRDVERARDAEEDAIGTAKSSRYRIPCRQARVEEPQSSDLFHD